MSLLPICGPANGPQVLLYMYSSPDCTGDSFTYGNQAGACWSLSNTLNFRVVCPQTAQENA